jgi:hypothetical protein
MVAWGPAQEQQGLMVQVVAPGAGPAAASPAQAPVPAEAQGLAVCTVRRFDCAIVAL